MKNLHRAIFIGVLWGITLIIVLASLTGPNLAYAATQDPALPGSGIFAPLASSFSTTLDQSAAEQVQNQPAPAPAAQSSGVFAPFVSANTSGSDQAAAAPAPSSNDNGIFAPFVSKIAAALEQAVSGQAQNQPSTASSSGGCGIGTNYPDSVRRWCDLIERHAGENGLDPNLVAAVMLQESGGNPDATSHSGAVGLLQVMPRDGIAASFRCVNGPCFASRPSMAQLYDPDFNLDFGTRMLAGLAQKYGSMREALRSYGPRDAGYTYADKVLAIYQRSQ
jgi:soluble lytic murein transglycosylase-like protein